MPRGGNQDRTVVAPNAACRFRGRLEPASMVPMVP
ncbi:hypothetical protein BSFP_058720 [Burkholderia stabilis]|uniref:Uncharacterized protein n=1 Tax=Burkholderia stabilis TaxID=95485 RepID=A0A1Y1BSV8_9BURK|nr:hypothetical protein BSFP_058720 [Burkholderia stabilis]